LESTQRKNAGERGEDLVAGVLARYKAPEAVVLNDLLFDSVDTTTQLDHILIDRFGLLLIETKFYNASISGTSSDRNWIAHYRDGRTRDLHSPLKQNESHRTKILRVLQQHGLRIGPEYTQSVVVFALGSISDLELTPEDSARVLDTKGLEHHLATRADFAPNAGALDTSTIASVAALLESLDKSGDAEVHARHLQMAKETAERHRARREGRRPARDRGTYAPRRSHPRPDSYDREQPLPWRLLAGMLGIAALLVLSMCSGRL